MPWVRTGPCPDEIKVSFVVKSAKDRELAEFLWRLPYRKASEQVRDILSAAAKQAAGRPGAARTGVTEQAEPVAAATEGYVAPGNEGSLGVEDVYQAGGLLEGEDGSHGMANEVAAVMQDMDRQF